MYLGTNLQFLRRQHGNMTQEQLAARMGVARQTVSKWESGESAPEIQKLMELCDLFSCTLDALLRQDLANLGGIYDPVRIERVHGFRYAAYTVISRQPERDSKNCLSAWAQRHQLPNPVFLGWGFPYLSQDQKHRHGLRGYVSAVILPGDFDVEQPDVDFGAQEEADYAVMTIRDPFSGSRERISAAYGLIIEYLATSGIKKKHIAGTLPCFERVYERDGMTCMDVYIHCQSPVRPDIITNFTQEE